MTFFGIFVLPFSPTEQNLRDRVIGQRQRGVLSAWSAFVGFSQLLSDGRLLSAFVGIVSLSRLCQHLLAFVGLCRLLLAFVGFCRLLLAFVGLFRLLSDGRLLSGWSAFVGLGRFFLIPNRVGA